MKWFSFGLSSLLLGFFCQVAMADQLSAAERKFLKNPDTLVLYAIQPNFDEPSPIPEMVNGKEVTPAKKATGPEFYGGPILAKAVVKSLRQKMLVINAFEKGILDHNTKAYAGCFQPHHGLRVTKGRERYDYLICLECGHIEAFHNGKRLIEDPRVSYEYEITHSPASVFDAILYSTDPTLKARWKR